MRGPLIRQAFELYATGEYTLQGLADELTHRGLKTRAGRYPAGPISDSKLSKLLREPYYVGIVRYKGEEYEGRHEPLISMELFDSVQQVLDTRKTAGERRRVHHHYLKGSLWCGACRKRGRESRLLIQRANGRGGTYFYFFCAAKQKHLCDEPYIAIDLVEEAVTDHYRTLVLDPRLVRAVRDLVSQVMADDQAALLVRTQHVRTKLAKLDVQEENLLDLIADGDIPSSKAKERLRRIAAERLELQALLEDGDDRLEAGAKVLNDVLDLLEKPGQLYERSNDQGRRLINQAIFSKLYIEQDEVTDDLLHEPFESVVDLDRAVRAEQEAAGTPCSVQELAGRLAGETKKGRSTVSCRRPFVSTGGQLLGLAVSQGSSSRSLVELRRIELLTSSMPWKRSTN